MYTIKDYIVDRYELGDCEGLEALKEIASIEDKELIDGLIKDSWKVVTGTYENDEDVYHEMKKDIFIKYGFRFDMGDLYVSD